MKTKRTFQSLFVALVVLSLGQVGFTTLAPQMPEVKQLRYKVQVPATVDTIHLSKQLIAHGFDVAGVSLKRQQVEVITDEAGVEYIKTLGYQGQVFKPADPAAAAPDTKFLNPKTLTEKLQAINAAYPQLTRLEQIGTSHQGRPIWGLLVSSAPQANDPNKPTLIVDGLHHAREIMTPEVVVDIAETLLKGATTGNQQLTALVEGWNVWVVPMLNMDGSNIVWTNNSMWRKNARSGKASIHGVDLNRNYVYKWNACGGSSGSTWSETYRGPSAGSEPETKALMGLAEKVRPTAYLSYHSYSELVLVPYGCNGQFSAQAVLENNVGKELSKRLPYDDGGGFYDLGTPWQLLYDVDGDSMDHIHATFGALAFTFEVNQDFHPPYSLKEPTLKKHREAWTYFLTTADQNLLTVNVVDSKTHQPVVATLNIDTIVINQDQLPYSTNEIGKFFKVLEPGSYTIAVKLADGRRAEAHVLMQGSPQSVTLAVQ